MCGIDCLYCWFYDNEKYWYSHWQEYIEAERIYSKSITDKNIREFHSYLDKTVYA